MRSGDRLLGNDLPISPPLRHPALASRPAGLIRVRMNDPSPVGSELDTAEEAEAYLRWLKAKVAESRADSWPSVEHDEAMRQIRTIIEAKAGKH